MSIDTTFRPLGPTVLVGTAAVSPGAHLSSGCSTFRVRCLVSAYLGWGNDNVGAPVAPAAGVPAVNTLGFSAGDIAYVELPYNVFFISSVAASFEVTPGQGGTGG